jgi:hypothetical protein
MDLAGFPAPPTEGLSLRSVLESDTPVRSELLLEHAGGGAPAYCEIGRATRMFVHYETGEEELYNYLHDPYELRNRAYRVRSSSEVASLRADALLLCNPLPPGFSW